MKEEVKVTGGINLRKLIKIGGKVLQGIIILWWGTSLIMFTLVSLPKIFEICDVALSNLERQYDFWGRLLQPLCTALVSAIPLWYLLTGLVFGSVVIYTWWKQHR